MYAALGEYQQIDPEYEKRQPLGVVVVPSLANPADDEANRLYPHDNPRQDKPSVFARQESPDSFRGQNPRERPEFVSVRQRLGETKRYVIE